MIPALPSVLLPGAPEAHPSAGGDAQAFALSLEAAGAALAVAGPKRQGTAAGGKSLPVEAADAPGTWPPIMATDTEQAEQASPYIVIPPAITPSPRLDGFMRAAKVRHASPPQPNTTPDDSAADERVEPEAEHEARPIRTDPQPSDPVRPASPVIADLIGHPACLSAGEPVEDASGNPAQGRGDEGQEGGAAGYAGSLGLNAPSAQCHMGPAIARDDRLSGSTSPVTVADAPLAEALASTRSARPRTAPLTASPSLSSANAVPGPHAPTTDPSRLRAPGPMAITPESPVHSPPEPSSAAAAARMDRAPAQRNPSIRTPVDLTIMPTSRDTRPSRAGKREGEDMTVAPDTIRVPGPDTVTSPTRSTLSGPAAQVFAAELRRGARDERRSAEPAQPIFPGLRADTVRVDAPQPPLDMRAERWPEAMVERIERLRDAADAADTTIRLSPDALGSVEVSVRQDGDAVHVRFEAERAETRALLQDAAPRLAEAAEARGVRLGQTSVGGDAAGSGRQGRGPPAPPQPSATARALTRAEVTENLNDIRIA